MRQTLRILLTLLLLAFCMTSCTGLQNTGGISDVEQQLPAGLPPAPEGFDWVVFKGVALRAPTGWHTFSKGNTFCSSVESIEELGSFETGATIQVLRNVQETVKAPASVAALHMVQEQDKRKENTRLILTTNEHENLSTIVYRYRNAPATAKPIIVHKYFQYSDRESFVNIVTFEAPEESFDRYWEEQGKVMLSMVATLHK